MDRTVKIDYTLSDKVQDAWSEYDKAMANIHLRRYGQVILDTYGLPIDNEFVLEEIESTLNVK